METTQTRSPPRPRTSSELSPEPRLKSGGSLFGNDLDEKKKEMYDNIATKPYDVADFYKESGPIVRLCTDSAFETMIFLTPS